MSTTDQLLQKILDQMQKPGQQTWGQPGNLQSKDPLADLQASMRPTKEGFSGMAGTITNNLKVWRELSSVGANFSNDVIGMSIAAKEARMELGEFQQMIAKSAPSFAGLGGSVTRGVEAFGKLTKEFQDTTFAKDLDKLGLTTAEANEMLALQIGFQKQINMNDANSRKAAFDATSGLVKEMDFLAKVTGKSRELQEKELRDQQRKGEVEAKFRLIGIEKGAKAEEEARKAYAQQYAQAAARGQGELFEDMFTKGVPASEEAATQLALTGKAGQFTAESAKLLGEANITAADAVNKRAQAEMAQIQNNKTFLTQAVLGPLAGTAGAVAVKSVEANDALFQSVKKVAEANGILLQSQQDYAAALKIIRDDVVKSQQGIDASGKKVSGATEGLVAFERGMKDTQAALYGAMDIANKSGKTIADSLRNVGAEISKGVTDMGNIRGRMTAEFQAGLRGQGGGLLGAAAAGGQTIAEGLEVPARTGVRMVAEPFKDPNAPVAVPATPPTTAQGTPQPRSGGTYGAGLDTEKVGSILEITSPGEVVLNAKQQRELATGLVDKGAEKALEGIKSSLVMPSEPKNSNISLSSIKEDIKTTFSSVIGSSNNTQNSSEDSEERKKFIKQINEQEAKFRLIGLEKGAEEEKKARENYAKELLTGIRSETAIREEYAKEISKEKEKLTGQDLINKSGIVKDGKIDLNMFDAPGITGFGTALKPKAEQKPANTNQAQQAVAKTEKQNQAQQATQQAGRVNEPTAKQAVAKTEEQKREAARQQQAQQQTPQSNMPATGKEKATLDDVVTSLNRLNTQMSQLVSQQADLMRKQINVTRANSANLYEQVG